MRSSTTPTKKHEKKLEVPVVYRTKSYYDLFDAIGEGKEDKVNSVLQTSKDPIGLMKKKDLQGLTPLRKAMALNRAEIARLLVVAGADAGQKGALDKLALHDAALLGRRLLMAPLLTSPNIAVNVKDKMGNTPLHYAVRGKHIRLVEWLLFAGADINSINNHDESPINMCNPESENEEERRIFELLEKSVTVYDSLDLAICSGYVGHQQVCNMGLHGALTIVTSELWPLEPQFIFCIRVTPAFADPPIPLRQDERIYCNVYKYRLIYKLPRDQRRVKLYFTILEDFTFSELILKVCSKNRFLGEVPIEITTYPYQKYIHFLGSCELDLQSEGQFVLVKRPQLMRLVPDAEGILGCYKTPLFKLAVNQSTFGRAPPTWNATRHQREWEDYQKIQEHDGRKTSDESHNTNRSALEAQDDSEGLQEQEEDPYAAMLTWSEPDTCEDFYFISRGWECYLEYRYSSPMEVINRKYPEDIEHPQVLCMTSFFRFHHPSGKMHKDSLCQIPKMDGFVKVGTVLVFQRKELGPGEMEDPYPDEKQNEPYLSEDGRRTHGKVWLQREMKRWSLIPGGFANKPTRIIFKADKLCTYVGVQLNYGEEKWEKDDGESSSEDESEIGEEGEGGEQELGEDGEPIKKKKKKKKKKVEGDEEHEAEGDENENAMSVGRNTNVTPQDKNNNINVELVDDGETIFGGIEPTEGSFALGMEKGDRTEDLEEAVSNESLGQLVMRRTLSINMPGKRDDGMEEFGIGPPRKEDEFEEEKFQSILAEIALNWRCRSHREVKVMVFSRYIADMVFDLVVELVQVSDLTVRADARWMEGFKMVACSASFLSLTGRLFSFRFTEGTLIFESPGAADGTRPMLYYAMFVNEIVYRVKRKAQEETVMPGKKKKLDPAAESTEVDTSVQVTAYPSGTKSEGEEILSLPIPLTGPNIWKEQHLLLRLPDEQLLGPMVEVLIQDETFTINWWRIWVLLHFDDKQIDVEKVKQDWPEISQMMLKKWFQQSIDFADRGITRLINVIDSLRLEVPNLRILGELKKYKRKLEDVLKPPRQLDLLYHWMNNTKMTIRSFRRRAKEPILAPQSDDFLLYLNEHLNPHSVLDMGPPLELEDSVMNAINGEENIADPKYKTFRAMLKCRTKKEELIPFVSAIAGMTVSLGQTDAFEFILRESRRWMATIVDTSPDVCFKLETILKQLIHTMSMPAASGRLSEFKEPRTSS